MRAVIGADNPIPIQIRWLAIQSITMFFVLACARKKRPKVGNIYKTGTKVWDELPAFEKRQPAGMQTSPHPLF